MLVDVMIVRFSWCVELDDEHFDENRDGEGSDGDDDLDVVVVALVLWFVCILSHTGCFFMKM